MEFDREFERSLRRISTILRKIILQSEEFRGLRSLLKQGKVEMRLFLVPVLFEYEKRRKRKKSSLQFRLTDADRQFLKKVGIRF